LGNHDFDYGVETLLGFLDEIKCPVVVSNMNTSQEPLWPDATKLVQSSVIVNVNGERIGFVGYILLETSRYENMYNQHIQE
jgi:5'-nucleotidase